MAFSLTGATPTVVEDNGGEVLEITGEFPAGPLEVYVDDGENEHPCYSGVSGKGYAPEAEAGMLRAVVPPLPIGSGYTVRVRSGEDVREIHGAFDVVNRNFRARVFALRQLLPPGLRAGPRVVEQASALKAHFAGGTINAPTMRQALLTIASAGDTTARDEADSSLFVNGADLGPYRWAKRTDSAEIVLDEAALDDLLGEGDVDDRITLLFCNAPMVTLTHDPFRRRPGLYIYVPTHLRLESNLTFLGANHSASGSNRTAQSVLLDRGSFGGIVDPEIPAVGGTQSARANASSEVGKPGGAGLGGGTGGGGGGACSGGSGHSAGIGASGTSYSAGSGGGGARSVSASDFPEVDAEGRGGKGGDGVVGQTHRAAGGGAGNPGGDAAASGNGVASPGGDGTGGAGAIWVPKISGPGSIIADGQAGGRANAGSVRMGGGGSGGGAPNLFCDDVSEWEGDITANGGEGGLGANGLNGGPGGLGSPRLMPFTVGV